MRLSQLSRGALVAFVSFGLPVPSDPAQPLTVGHAIERQLAVAESHAYRVSLHRGDYVQVTIGQRSIDVVAALISPDGHDLLVLDAVDDDFRDERLVVIADADGDYTLAIRPVARAAVAGRYTVRLDESRPSTPADDDRIAAEREFEAGRLIEVSRRSSAQPDAIVHFQDALDRFRHSDDRRGQLKTLISLSYMQFNTGQGDALASAQDAERLARELGDQAGLAAAFHRIGLARRRRGELAAALAAEEQSTAISRAIGNHKAEAASLNGEGIDYASTDDAEKAVVRFQEALQAARAVGYTAFEANVLNNLGNAYSSLGELEKALDAFERSLQRLRADGNRDAEMLPLNNMGNLWHQLHNETRALELHTQALEISRERGDRENEARSLNTIGVTYCALGDFARALTYHRAALEMRRTLRDLPGQAASLQGVGRALNHLGQREGAQQALDEALRIRRTIRDQFGERDTLRDLAVLARDDGRLDDAVTHVRAAVDLEERLRARITSPQLRTMFVAAEEDKYALLIDLLQQRHRRDPAAGYDAEALGVSERARARVLLESLFDAHVDLRIGIDPALLERERQLQQQLSVASTQLSRALAMPTPAAQGQAAEAKVDRLTREYQQLEADIRRQSPHYAALTQPEPLEGGSIAKTVLDDDTVLLEFALGAETSWLWAVTPQAIVSVQLPPRSTIEAAARSLYARVTARQKHNAAGARGYSRRVLAADRAFQTEALTMSRLLLGGIADRLSHDWRDKRLAIVATGALEALPFAALPEPGSAGTGTGASTALPLIARHEIVMIPSASVVDVLRREAASRQPATGTVAIVADPVFVRSDPRVAAKTVVTRSLTPGVFTAPPERLLFSREEANAIATLARPGEVVKATGFRASRDIVLDGTLARFRIVHFATHGIVDSQRPALTGLVLSLIDERGETRDGYLRLHDIYNLRLNADLVVLSACDTALGQSIRGEGLVGLVRAFMYAGAPRVVASLWEVNDVATAQLMTTFYRGLLRQKLTPAAALRAAQREIAKDPRWAAPYYWAGFVLQGDWH